MANRIPQRHELAKLYGRRVSRGEHERITTLYVPYKIHTSSNSKGRPPEMTPRIVIKLHPECIKARRKAV